jgi:CheY-like chemotaxis protein
MKEQTRSRKIFLIDDDAVTNFVNTKIIKFAAPTVEVIAFTNARLALQELNQCLATPEQLPDFILLDINMPEVDGWDFLEEFVTLPQPVPEKTKVIMLTSSVDTNDIARSRTYKPVIDFLSKPLNSANVHQLTGSQK